MAIRQEQIVLIAAVALLGYMGWSASSEVTRKPSRRSTPAPDFVHHSAPEVDLVLPLGRVAGGLERELFSAPTDTRPLPPLAFQAPPPQALEGLRPAPVPNPTPRLFGRFLRRKTSVTPSPGLFEEAEAVVDTGTAEFEVTSAEDLKLLTPEERMELIAGYKRIYDWVDLGNLHFGQIQNQDRYLLSTREDEEVIFLELDPATGRERFPGAAPFQLERERVESFGFADTTENRIELARLQYAGEVTQGQYHKLLDFATWCVTQRLETPRALEVAVEMYTKAIPLGTTDPTPRLGLALCHEQRFEFEEAFEIYDVLVKGDYADHPLVLSRLAQLEARFRLTRQAEEHLRAAESYGRTEWMVQWVYGRFLLDTERPAEAVEHLRLAAKFEPTEAEFLELRARIRTDLGDSLVAVGELDEARSLYTRALQADPTAQRALAGLLTVAYLSGTAPDPATLELAQTDGAEFELLLALGLVALQEGDFPTARANLDLAAEADPLRAGRSWRALSYLAEVTGNEEEALEYIDLADQNDPTDVYALIQRGRILAQRDDHDGAMEAFVRALDRELELPDVLGAMGELAMIEGRFEDAERYFGRSVEIDGSVGPLHSLRGLNALFLGQARDAEDHFDRALRIDDDDPVAGCGRAWCSYVDGDPTEAKTRFREFEDSRRHLGEEDPYRLYAIAEIDRISDHQEKVVWSDRFERLEIRNGWKLDEEVGPKIILRDGQAVIEGSFERAGRTRLKRSYSSGDFVSFEAKLTIRGGTNVRAGIFVAMENRRETRSESPTTAEVTLSRNPDRTIQYRSMSRGREDDDYVDSAVMSWPDEQTVTLRLERFGDSNKTAFRVLVDGVAIVERLPMTALGATTRDIWVGIFAEGDPGRTMSLSIDDVEVVKRERK